MNRLYLLTITLLLSFISEAQMGANDFFYDQLPYSRMISLAYTTNEIYAASEYGILIYDKEEKSVSRLTKVEGLSDVGIKWIDYNETYNTLVIVYENANIDLVKDNKIVNISDIKRKVILGEKTIHSIFLKDKYAYLSCGFGIVVLDIEREEIYDTYKIGPNGSLIQVYDLTFHPIENKFYAATELGIYSADYINTNLAHYENWNLEVSENDTVRGEFNQIEYFHNAVFANKYNSQFEKDTVYYKSDQIWDQFDKDENHLWANSLRAFDEKLLISHEYGLFVFDTNYNQLNVYYVYEEGSSPNLSDAIILDGTYWLADKAKGLVKLKDNFDYEQIEISGPQFPSSYDIDTFNDQVWVASGGRKSGDWSGVYLNHGFYALIDGDWTSYNSGNTEMLEGISDYTCIAIEPNLGVNKYVGTWSHGIVEMINDEVVNIYNQTNSSLQINTQGGSDSLVQISGMEYDKYANLWVVNTGVDRPLSVLKPNGEWKSFDFGAQLSNKYLGEIMIDNDNQKWIIMRNGKICVFSDNETIDNTSDDKYRILGRGANNGNLLGDKIRSIACDDDNNIWIGTNEGVSVIYNPEDVLDGGSINAEKPKVEVDGFVQYLLNEEVITAIKVDGANNKWFGTERAGIFLMGPDGTEQFKQFNVSNSPLFSNEITALGINSLGFVFIGTTNGLISFKGETSPGAQSNNDIFIYPNPVRNNDKGPITITNLMKDSNVKITDLSGDLVYEDFSSGGQVVWDGNNFDGDKVKPGYYLVFVTDNQTGENTQVSKILILR